MSNPKHTVLVVGGTGRFASLVVPAITRQGATVRALVRAPDKEQQARANGATEVAIGDLRDPQALQRAMEGATGVFHIGPAFVADEAELGTRLVDAARRSGVRKIVFSSVIHPTNTSLANHASKIPVEDAIFGSGLDYTILHPAMFFQNIAARWPVIVERGVFAEPIPIRARVARVDYRDVAEVAARAFVDERLAYGTFELCAGMPDSVEIAAIMSEVLGRRIVPREVSFEDWAANLPLGPDQKQLLANVFRRYAASGSGGNSLVLEAILGRKPTPLRRYIEELAAQSPSTGAT